MSYVEHGPRIFLAGRPSNGITLTYGDYVLPQKRSEGRLKMYDSCSDIRAWSPNPLENSRYFRELTEHAPPPSRIVPFNVVIDNIIELNSQTRKELQQVRKELEKYKSLQLTHEQEDYLQSYDESATGDHKRVNERTNEQESGTLSKQALISVDKSVSVTQSDCYLSIHLRPAESLQDDSKYGRGPPLMNHRNQLAGWQRFRTGSGAGILTTSDGHLVSNGNPADPCLRTEARPFADAATPENYPLRKQILSCVEFADAFSQAEQVRDIRDVHVQTDTVGSESCSSKTTLHSVNSETSSLVCQCCTRGSTHTLGDERISKEDNNDESAFEAESSSSQDSLDSEDQTDSEGATDSSYDFEKRKRAYKKIIIKKDSEIISLTHELRVKEADINELRDLNRNFEDSMKEKEKSLNMLLTNLKISQDKLGKMSEERSYEVANLNKKLHAYTGLIEELQEDLDEKCQFTEAQRQEIEKLRLSAKETATLHADKEAFVIKLCEMERQLKDGEDRIAMLEQLKSTLIKERDQLQNQTRQQSCALADQEDEIKRLLTSICEICDKYTDRQFTMENEMNVLRSEIQRKDEKISQCEEQLIDMGKEINELQDKLKNGLMQNLDEFQSAYNGLQEFTLESENTENQNISDNSRGTTMSDQRLDTESIYQDFNEDTGKKDVITLCSVTKTESWESDELPESDIRSDTNMDETLTESTSVNNDLDKESTDLPTWQIPKESYERMNRKLRNGLSMVYRKNNADEVEKEFLMNMLQVYMEEERPLNEMILHDKHVDSILARHIKYFIDKMCQMSASLQGAGDEHTKIVREVEKQRREIEIRDKEIARLMEQVAERGDGDCPEDREKAKLAHQRLMDELTNKNGMVQDLQKQLNVWSKKFNALRAEKEGVVDDLKELRKDKDGLNNDLEQTKNEIGTLVKDRDDARMRLDQQKDTIKRLKDRLGMIEEMNSTLESLQAKNAELRKKLNEADNMRLKNEECILNLTKACDEKEINLSRLTMNWDIAKEKQRAEMGALMGEKAALSEKCCEIERKLAERENTISEYTEEKLDLMNNILGIVSKSGEDKKKFQLQMDKLKAQLADLCTNNNILEQTLEGYLQRIALLEREIKCWRDKDTLATQQLSTVLAEQPLPKDDLKKTLFDLPCKLYEKILSFKRQAAVIANPEGQSEQLKTIWDNKNFVQKKRSKERHVDKVKCREEIQKHRHGLKHFQSCQLGEEHFLNRYEDLITALDLKDNELKELRAKLSRVGKNSEHEKCISNDIEDEISKDAEVTKDTNDVPCDITKMRYKLKCLESDNAEKQIELQKLTCDVERRDFEIKTLTEKVNRLSHETEELHRKLKVESERYEIKLAGLKKTYDSSLNAFHKRHDEDVERLQATFFDDTVKGGWAPYDSEKWLKSLGPKELTELQNQIRALSSSFDDRANRVEQNLIDKYELHEKINGYEEKFREMHNDARYKVDKLSSELRYENQKLSELKILTEEQRRLSDKNHPSCNVYDRNGTMNDFNRNNANSETRPMDKNAASRLHSTNLVYKNEFGLFDNTHEKVVKDTKLKLINEPVKDDTFVKQRKNFIYQCSMYHRSGNNA